MRLRPPKMTPLNDTHDTRSAKCKTIMIWKSSASFSSGQNYSIRSRICSLTENFYHQTDTKQYFFSFYLEVIY